MPFRLSSALFSSIFGIFSYFWFFFAYFVTCSYSDFGKPAGRGAGHPAVRNRKDEGIAGGGFKKAARESTYTPGVPRRDLRPGLHLGGDDGDPIRGLPQLFAKHVELHRL